MFRDAPPNAPKVALRIENDVACPDCGYNLRGLRFDGRCPECGRPTIDTFARPLRASTGALAEEMIRRPGGLLITILAWWIIFCVSKLAPPALAKFLLAGAAAATAPLLLLVLVRLGRLARLARSRRGGSSRPLRSIASLWFWLGALAILLGLVQMALAVFWPSPLELILWLALIVAASGSAAASHLLAAQAAVTVLHRLSLGAPGLWVPAMGIGLAGLIAACLAPFTGGLLVSARFLAGFVFATLWLAGCYHLLSTLREAQGSVVSIGRSARR